MKKFGSDTITLKHLQCYMKNHKITSGVDARFRKGQESWNKGKKQTDFMTPEGIEKSKAGWFKRGHVPHNGGSPVGTLRLRKGRKGSRPYYYEKVEQPSKWRPKHILVWEEENGAVPKGGLITFANGDSTDYRIENLVLTTRARNAVKNHMHLKSYDKQSAELINTLIDLKSARQRKKKAGV